MSELFDGATRWLRQSPAVAAFSVMVHVVVLGGCLVLRARRARCFDRLVEDSHDSRSRYRFLMPQSAAARPDSSIFRT
jgi:hypothetical protein